VVIKEDRLFAISARNGDMEAGSVDGHGLWLGDTRFLSEFELLVNGGPAEPVSLEAATGSLAWRLTSGPFEIVRERYLASGMHDRITITNTSGEYVSAEVELGLGADFAAMLAVRGIVQLPARRPARIETSERGLVLRDGGKAGRQTEIVLEPPGPKQTFALAPQESSIIEVHVLPHAGLKLPDFDAGLAKAREVYDAWARDCAHFETDNHALNELIEQSRDDMRMLCDRYPTGIYPTGGLPWFAVPFGRDALFTSMFALPMNPSIAHGALRFLAAHQGKRENSDTEEQPGKILHEVRNGDVVDSGIWPHILYGTVDATALFLVALAETHDWTGDDGLLAELWPAAEAALAWCERLGDSDGDGWIDYRGARAHNQGWKDSDDSLTHTDGAPAPPPAALCEVQGYWYRGLLGLSHRRPDLREAAASLRTRFGRDFWMARERFVAQALDGGHRQVRALTSNPGHCLWTGILPASRARRVASRLMEPDLWSGWGIRTLSESAVNYEPCSYHNGSVWPHDSTLAAAGMRSAGADGEAEALARAILEAGMSFPDRRLPELWCGTPREPGRIPDDYRNSCSPQNWAAASTFSLLSTLLGLRADAKRLRLRIAPLATPLFNRLEVTGLHFAGQLLDFAVEGTEVKLGRVPRGIRVVGAS
jgi:glycogen debranching enzyme